MFLNEMRTAWNGSSEVFCGVCLEPTREMSVLDLCGFSSSLHVSPSQSPGSGLSSVKVVMVTCVWEGLTFACLFVCGSVLTQFW